MRKILVLGSLVLGSVPACAATGSYTSDSDALSSPRVQLALAPQPGTARALPDAIAPAVPRVDRIGREVRGTLGDRATASLDLCVALDGRVARAALAQSSTFTAFDRALVADAAGWRFEARPGPADLATCARVAVTYRPY